MRTARFGAPAATNLNRVLLVLALLAAGGCARKSALVGRVDESRTPAPAPPPLQARLESFRANCEASASPQQPKMYEEHIGDLRRSGLQDGALKVGVPAPDFELPGAGGEPVTLCQLLKRGPAVLLWYRGGWCPCCAIELRAYQETLPEFRALGAMLVAISPQTADSGAATNLSSASARVVELRMSRIYARARSRRKG
jgi:hypothetical protein